ncbi:hypothetical protein FB451DRAFT_1206148, partial [Mycena latifolia]
MKCSVPSFIQPSTSPSTLQRRHLSIVSRPLRNPSPFLTPQDLSDSPTLPALLVSSVCRAWRSIAFKSPRLWASFLLWAHGLKATYYLALDCLGNEPHQRRCPWFCSVGRIERYLIDPGAANSMARCRVTHPIRPPRITKVHSSLYGRLPALQQLQIADGFFRPSANTAPVSIFEKAPNLRTLHLDRLPPALIILRWAQLTHFTGERLLADDCLHVLALAVSLECKFIEVAGGDL